MSLTKLVLVPLEDRNRFHGGVTQRGESISGLGAAVTLP